MIFALLEYRYLLKSTDQVGEYEIAMHPYHEKFLIIHNEVGGKSCYVIGSFAALPERVLELLFLCHTLKKEGALKISLISPYLGYSRQDHNESLKSYGLQWAFDIAAACGVDEIISIDIHNSKIERSVSLRPHSIDISPYPLWEVYFYQYAQQGYSFVMPDKGAYNRYEFLHRYTWAYFEKKRNAEDIEMIGMLGKVHKKVVIVDDILDTGTTLLQTCIALQKIGVEEIIVFVTHGVFSNTAWHQIFSLGVKFMYCTNSLPEATFLNHPCIKTVSIRPLLNNYL